MPSHSGLRCQHPHTLQATSFIQQLSSPLQRWVYYQSSFFSSYVFPPLCFLFFVFISRSTSKITALLSTREKKEYPTVKVKIAALQRLVIRLASGRAKTEWQGVRAGKWGNKGETWEMSATGASTHIEYL